MAAAGRWEPDRRWPLPTRSLSQFENSHTGSAILCGDFNLETTDAEYRVIQAPAPDGCTAWCDAWPLANGQSPHPPTFRLHDKRYGPVPISCDFVFVSDDLRGRVHKVSANTESRAFDHQPVLLELGY